MADLPCSMTLSPDARRVGLAARLLALLGKRRWRRSPFHTAGDLPRVTERDAYMAWRVQSLRRQLEDHFDVSLLAGRRVLDFGCGRGELTTLLVTDYGAASAVGIDLAVNCLADAREALARQSADVQARVEFLHAANPKDAPLPDAAFDTICCFDVVEHIPDVAATCRLWHRLLAPGGRVWIWWSPWRGPYGHHVEALLALPWIHLILPPRTIFDACGLLYDDPNYVPRLWDRELASGQKRPNPWWAKTSYAPFLNQLTRAGFERAAQAAGLRIARRADYGFGGSWKTRWTRFLRHAPLVGECFVSYYIYELERPRAVDR